MLSYELETNASSGPLARLGRELVFHIYVKYMLNTYLNAVLRGLKFHIENNIIVKENQFGKHRWYSA